MILTEPVKPVGTRPAREVERNRTDESTDRTPRVGDRNERFNYVPGYEEMRQ